MGESRSLKVLKKKPTSSFSDSDCVRPKHFSSVICCHHKLTLTTKHRSKKCPSAGTLTVRKKLTLKPLSPESTDSEAASELSDYLQTLSACPVLERKSSKDNGSPDQPDPLQEDSKRTPTLSEVSSIRKSSVDLSSEADTTVASDFDSCDDSFKGVLDRSDKKIGETQARKKTSRVDVVSPRRERIISRRLQEMAERFEREELKMRIGAGSAETDDASLIDLEPRSISLRRFLAKRRERRQQRISAKNQEIKRLENELRTLEEALARTVADDTRLSRCRWEDQPVTSLSTELFGNFTDNEKVRFSYETLLQSSARSSVSSLPQHHKLSSVLEYEPCQFPHSRSEEQEPFPCPYCNDNQQRLCHPFPGNVTVKRETLPQERRPQSLDLQVSAANQLLDGGLDSNAEMPKPVESAIKYFKPVQDAATHDRYSPKPTRRRVSSGGPRSTHPATNLIRAFSDSSGPTSFTGAVGVTSMWIPMATPSTLPRRFSSFKSDSPVRPQKSLGLGLARKILMQQLLPSKAEGTAAELRRVCAST